MGAQGEERAARDLELSYCVGSQTAEEGEGRGAFLGLKGTKKGEAHI